MNVKESVWDLEILDQSHTGGERQIFNRWKMANVGNRMIMEIPWGVVYLIINLET